MKKWLGVLAKFIISGTLIWFLMGNIDLASAKQRLFEIDPWMLALATFIFLYQIIICVFRWRVVLKAIDSTLSFMDSVRIFYIGLFFNQTLPSSVGGDVVRIFRAYRAGLTLGGAVNGVMLERATTVLALLVVVAATQPFFLHRVDSESASWMLYSIAILAAVAVAGLAVLMLMDRMPDSLKRWQVARGLTVMAADARKVFLKPGNLVKSIGWACIGHLNLTLGVYFLAIGLKLDVTWVDCLALIPPVILITTLPISIAGWGVREGAMVYAFGLIGVPSEGALVLSLMFGLVIVATSLPGGIVWLTSGGLDADARAKKVVAEATANEQIKESEDNQTNG